jgi:hypothetical protein
VGRETYLRSGKSIDQRVTARALDRVADWLDIADSQTVTAIYPEVPECEVASELPDAWMWAAILIADMTDAPSEALHQLATVIRSMYVPSDT